MYSKKILLLFFTFLVYKIWIYEFNLSLAVDLLITATCGVDAGGDVLMIGNG
jgi:hypothetical protein